ncbi:MAG: Crp/Fnr family transcriptional regulator [Burkholderiales bacterium]|nr:Crp/Fnr family transcriptional regulator [Burkholderiales bacterium]
MARAKTERIQNRLLAALSRADYKKLLPDLRRVELTLTDELYRAGETVRHAWFPDSGIVSLLSTAHNHSSVEIGVVGNEGIAGVNVFLGVAVTRHRALVQAQGSAMRMSAAALRRHVEHSAALRRLLMRYTHALMMQIAQSAVCLRTHTVEERAARWLLLTLDFGQSDVFSMTQEFMVPMLGVRRERVTQAAGKLQKQGLIRYSRGEITVLDRPGLKAAACECYPIIRAEYDFLR